MTIEETQIAKMAAARAAAAHIADDTIVGLGTGSTSEFFHRALADRLQRGDLRGVRGVPTSDRAASVAASLGIPLAPLTTGAQPDVDVDGADEIDPNGTLIKGAGGALVREKLVALAARKFIVIGDASKRVTTIGAVFPLPVAVVPFGWETTQQRIEAATGRTAHLRVTAAADGTPFRTDDGLFLLDLEPSPMPDPAELQRTLKSIVGVVEVGLFVGMATRIVIGNADGSVDEIEIDS